MNVHMKNTKLKYKLNFKTMKKGLLTLWLPHLYCGCQNYDDQFDDLNAQISALSLKLTVYPLYQDKLLHFLKY